MTASLHAHVFAVVIRGARAALAGARLATVIVWAVCVFGTFAGLAAKIFAARQGGIDAVRVAGTTGHTFVTWRANARGAVLGRLAGDADGSFAALIRADGSFATAVAVQETPDANRVGEWGVRVAVRSTEGPVASAILVVAAGGPTREADRTNALSTPIRCAANGLVVAGRERRSTIRPRNSTRHLVIGGGAIGGTAALVVAESPQVGITAAGSITVAVATLTAA